MADPQTADQGFLAGLLGKFGADPAAAYGGLLSDPATQRQFALRSLGAAAQAFGQGAMPVPYKGGIPFGATLGAAGGAASTAGDELIKARLEQAQSEQAVQNAAALHAKQLATTEILKNYQDPNSIYNRGGGTGTGTGTGAGGSGTGTAAPGTPAALTGVGAGPRGIQAGGISPTDHYSFLLNNGASKNEATMLTSAANSESSFRPDLTHDHGIGYGLYGHNTDRLAAMRDYAGVGPNDPVPWQQQALFALAELRGEVKGLPGGGEPKAGAMVNAATNAQQLTDAQLAFERPNLNIAGGNRSQRLASTTEYWNKPPYAQSPTQTASAGDQPAAAPGSQVGPYAPVPGQPGPQGVYVPPGASPNAPPVRIEGGPSAPAAPPLKLPDPTSAAPPQLLTPPAAGAPGPVTGLLGQQPTQQVAAADAPQLSPAAAAVLQGINRQQAGGGLLASGSVAGDNAVPTGGPSPAAVAQAGPPHTGAAGAAELAGLLAQQPASAAPPTATPYTNAPPVTGQGAPAPGPAPGPAPPAPPPMPPPPPVAPPAPGPIPGAPSAQDVRDANRAVILHGIAGIPLPPNISEIAKFPMVGPTAQTQAAGTGAGQLPSQQQMELYRTQLQNWQKQQEEYLKYRYSGPTTTQTESAKQPFTLDQQANKAMWDIYVAQNKPRDPQRQGTFAFNPGTNQYTLNRETVEADGSTHQHISILDQNMKPLTDYDAGPTKASPGAVTTATGMASANVEDFKTVQKEASAAAQSLAQSTFMRQEAPNFYTGPNAHEVNFMNKALVSLGMGGDQAAKSAASYESFIKDGGMLTRSQAQALSSGKVGVQELQNVAGTMPGEENTPRGLDRTLAQIQGLSDYRLQKQAAMTDYMGKHAQSNDGFEAQFNKNVSPYTYMYMRMSDQDRADIRNQLSSTSGGRSDLQRMNAQIDYIKSNNLMPTQ